MKKKKGAKKKKCEIKVNIVRIDKNGMEGVEDGGRKIETGVKKIETNKQIKLENAVLDFMRRVEVEKVKKGIQ